MKTDDWETRVAEMIYDEWTRGKQYVDTLDDRFDEIYEMLRGERPVKNYDWQSNISINKVFQITWTVVSYIMHKIFGKTPLMNIECDYDKEGAYDQERLLEFYYTMHPGNPDFTPFYLNVLSWVLRSVLTGWGVMKKSWHQKLESEIFEQTVEVLSRDAYGMPQRNTMPRMTENEIPVEDWPQNEVINNRDIVVDSILKPGESIRKARYVIQRAVLDLGELYDSGIDYINLDKLTTDSYVDDEDKPDLDDLQVHPDSDQYTDIEVYERQGTFAVYADTGKPCFDRSKHYGEDKIEVREMIATIARQNGRNVLIRWEDNPAGEKTYVDIHLYLDPEKWQSIGVIEPFKDLQTALNDNINAIFDEKNQNLMPPVVVNKFALWDWDTMQYAPGQRWLVGGNPAESIMFPRPSRVTQDAWQTHMLFDSEIQSTSSATPQLQGLGKERAATTNILNAQMSASKLDFLVKMIEITGLIPNAQMDLRFVKKFAHPKTIQMILGKELKPFGPEQVYKFRPAASAVKMEAERAKEIQEDLQLIQIFQAMNNPKKAEIINMFLQNILRNRNWQEAIALLDEKYFEPQGEGGVMQMLNEQMQGPTPQNQSGLPMGQTEKDLRKATYAPQRYVPR